VARRGPDRLAPLAVFELAWELQELSDAAAATPAHSQQSAP
jgi:hypothetical protein